MVRRDYDPYDEVIDCSTDCLGTFDRLDARQVFLT